MRDEQYRSSRQKRQQKSNFVVNDKMAKVKCGTAVGMVTTLSVFALIVATVSLYLSFAGKVCSHI